MPKPPGYPEWLHQLEFLVFRSVLPFVFRDRNGIFRNGSCVAVELPSATVLITADHVVREALVGLPRPEGGCVAGILDLDLNARQINRNSKVDLATILITKEELGRLEIDGRLAVRPHGWPPSPVRTDDLIVFAGFPGVLRSIVSWDEGLLRAMTAQGIVTGTRVYGFWYRAERDAISQWDVETGEREPVVRDLGGLSGGPVFRVQLAPLVVAEFCGIVIEAPENPYEKQYVIFAGVEEIRDDGRLPLDLSRSGD